jgi:membrane protein implicated in regulation of membrane protease activity
MTFLDALSGGRKNSKMAQPDRVAVIVGAVVALVFIGAAAVVGVTLASPDASTTPVVTTLLAFVAPTIVGLLALLRNAKLNGEVKELRRHLTQATGSIETSMGEIRGTEHPDDKE